MAQKPNKRESQEAVAHRLTDLGLKKVTLEEAKKIRDQVAKEQKEAAESRTK